MEVRECLGLPCQEPLCPLCRSLARLSGLAHQGLLTQANLGGLTNRVRALYCEVLDVLQISGLPVAAGEVRNPKQPPETWEGARPQRTFAGEPQGQEPPASTTSRALTPARSSTEEKKDQAKDQGAETQAPVTQKAQDKDREEEKALESSKAEVEELEEETAEEELLEVDPVIPEVKEEDKSKKEHLSDRRGSHRGRSRSKRRRTGEDLREDHPKVKRLRPRSPSAKDRHHREGGRNRERSVSRGKGLVLRPKSPSYPPPGYKEKPGPEVEEYEEEEQDWGHYQSGGWHHRDYPPRGGSFGATWKKRSKGVTRAHRWEDIKTYGPDHDRKQLRESWQERRWK